MKKTNPRIGKKTMCDKASIVENIMIVFFFLACCGFFTGIIIPIADVIGESIANHINQSISK